MKQREIKFRYRVFLYPESREIIYHKTLKEVEAGLMVLNHKDYKILSRNEFTGLLDKLGKEIYEGDIIEFEKYEWYKSPVRTKENIDKLPPHREEVPELSFDGWRSKSDMDYIKVIGNIYQNKNLLK